MNNLYIKNVAKMFCLGAVTLLQQNFSQNLFFQIFLAGSLMYRPAFPRFKKFVKKFDYEKHDNYCMILHFRT
jgi:hypothetical protein